MNGVSKGGAESPPSRSRIAYTACRCSAVTGWQVLCGARKRVHAPAAGIKAVYVPHHSLRRTGSSVVIFPFNRCLARVAAVDPHAGCRRRALRRNLNAFDCRRFWCRYPVRNGAAVGHADARGLPSSLTGCWSRTVAAPGAGPCPVRLARNQNEHGPVDAN